MRAAIAVDAHVRRGDREREQRAPHGEHRRLKDIQRVDLVAVGPADAEGECAATDDRRKPRPRGRGQDLRVGQPADAPAAIEDDGGRDHRAGERPTPRLIHASDTRQVPGGSGAHHPLTAWEVAGAPAARPAHSRIASAARAAPSRRRLQWISENASRSSRTWLESSSSSSSASPSTAPCTRSWKNSGTRRRPASRFGCEKYGTFTRLRVRNRKAVGALTL